MEDLVRKDQARTCSEGQMESFLTQMESCNMEFLLTHSDQRELYLLGVTSVIGGGAGAGAWLRGGS